MPSCSVVIRAYNEASHLPRLLEGISHLTIKDVEVILVDSGSMDATISIAESFGARVVKIAADEFTFGRSLNFGLKAAQHEFSRMRVKDLLELPPVDDWYRKGVPPIVAALAKEKWAEIAGGNCLLARKPDKPSPSAD